MHGLPNKSPCPWEVLPCLPGHMVWNCLDLSMRPCRGTNHDGCCSFTDHQLGLSSSQPSSVLNGHQLFLLPCNCCVCIPKSDLAKFKRGGLPIFCLRSFIAFAFTVSRFSRGLCLILWPRRDSFNGASCTHNAFQKDSRMSMKTRGVGSSLNMDV